MTSRNEARLSRKLGPMADAPEDRKLRKRLI